MENKRFDELSRALAVSRSRRSVMKGLAGGLIAGAAGFSAGHTLAVRAQDGSGEQGDAGDPCSDVLTCGPGLVCAAGYCAVADGAGEQGDAGDPCSDVLPCGPGLICSEGYCTATDGSGEQGDVGDPCSEVLTCGPGLACQQGTCQAITLPATGAGATTSGPQHLTATLMGAAAVAGAAAIFSRRLQTTREVILEPAGREPDGNCRSS